jgi:hypothetical protein
MKITIEFDTDNAAFEDNPTLEVKELLEQASNKITGLVTHMEGYTFYTERTENLYASNGNSVGAVKVER